MQDLGVSTVGCVDKDSLLEALEAADRSLLLGRAGQVDAEEVGGEAAAAQAGADPVAVEAEPVLEAEPVEAEPVEAVPDEPFREEDLPEEVQERLAELRGMRLRDLRRELGNLGLPIDGCVDQESLTELLETQGPAAVLRAHKAKTEPHKTGDPSIPEIPKTPACEPKRGSAEVPIYMMRGVDQYGVKAGATKVIAMDIQCGPAAGPTRFILDTVSEHSLIKNTVARRIGGRVIGTPEWAQGADAKLHIRKASLGHGWLGKLHLGELEMASIAGNLPVPAGVAGILGLDFLRLFDWDIDFVAKKAKVTTTPKDGMGPVPYDLAGMRLVPLTPVRTPLELLACPIKLTVPGEDGASTDTMGIADLGASCSMCNLATAHKLGLSGPPEPYKPRKPPPPKEKKTKKGFGADAPPEPTFPQHRLTVDIGVGPQGPVRVETSMSVGDIEVFENMGLRYDWPAAVLGPDALCRSRLIISARLKSIWLPVE